MISNLWRILFFITQSTSVKKSFYLNTTDPEPPPSSTYDIKGRHYSARIDWMIRSGGKETCAKAADWSDRAQSYRPSDQVRAKEECCKPLTTLSPYQWLLNHQYSVLAPYGPPPTDKRWPHLVGGSTAPADRVTGSIPTTRRCRWGRNTNPSIVPLYFWYLSYNVVC